jgi:hypothetical protein
MPNLKIAKKLSFTSIILQIFIALKRIGVLKCEEPGVELDQTFRNIFFKFLEPETRVL